MLGDKMSDAWALVFRLADSVAEVGAETLGDTLSDAHALVDTLSDLQAEVEAETLGDKLRDAQHWSTRWLTL